MGKDRAEIEREKAKALKTRFSEKELLEHTEEERTMHIFKLVSSNSLNIPCKIV